MFEGWVASVWNLSKTSSADPHLENSFHWLERCRLFHWYSICFSTNTLWSTFLCFKKSSVAPAKRKKILRTSICHIPPPCRAILDNDVTLDHTPAREKDTMMERKKRANYSRKAALLEKLCQSYDHELSTCPVRQGTSSTSVSLCRYTDATNNSNEVLEQKLTTKHRKSDRK